MDRHARVWSLLLESTNPRIPPPPGERGAPRARDRGDLNSGVEFKSFVPGIRAGIRQSRNPIRVNSGYGNHGIQFGSIGRAARRAPPGGESPNPAWTQGGASKLSRAYPFHYLFPRVTMALPPQREHDPAPGGRGGFGVGPRGPNPHPTPPHPKFSIPLT